MAFASIVAKRCGQTVAIHSSEIFVNQNRGALTRGAIIQKKSGDIVGVGNTSITLSYDRSRSGDTSRGFLIIADGQEHYYYYCKAEVMANKML